ncbi:MAG TPA: MarR family transcriptional regulator [Gemmatimonadaceae bacterium]|jgi:MarR family transcriptional regulator for hemolysin|nr:MarR family transcriptional regulator [Gemmatimonadaceae bacterium]
MPHRRSARRATLEHTFLTALGPIRQSVRRIMDRELGRLGLSIAQASPLVLIAQHDGIRQGELADRLDIEGPTLVRMVTHLESMGLVTRQADPADQRARTLHLTAGGSDLAGRLQPLLDEVRAHLLERVTDADLAVCASVFESLRDAVARDDAGTVRTPRGTPAHHV